MYALFADALLLVHMAFALFIVLGLVVIWIGWAAGWGWIRNRWFRGAHLAAMAVVVLESVVGWFCPLTAWEIELRKLAGADPVYEGSFMHHWAQEFFYYDLSPTVFLVIYVLFFFAMVGSVFAVPVRWRGRKKLPDIM